MARVRILSDDEVPRPVGRPRHFADADERELLVDAGYVALRDHGQEFTIAAILTAAGVSTRSFYRQFESKDALLCAMYERDSIWVANRIIKRLAGAGSPVEAVELWIDEVLGFTRTARRAERVSVFSSLLAGRAAGIEHEVRAARERLLAPLRAAVEAGVSDGTFITKNPVGDAELVSAAVLHAAGLASPAAISRVREPEEVIAFCLRALGFHGSAR